MSWQPVIGLEIHAQLLTASKIFSAADNTYGGAPNSKACQVDLGLPGVLPVLNENAVKMAIKFGLAIGAKINQESIFDRKNYFYPDLPKGYQISQFEKPIVGEGKVTIDSDSGEKTSIRITRAHLEEDAGKSTHDMFETETAIDLNRTGTPLLEIVSEPDLHSAKDAATYFRTIQELVKYLKICDGDLSRGSMRCDANVSIKKSEATELGERTEIKNINSFRFVEQAINSEIQRQIEVLEAGGRIERETRLFDEVKNETRSMRSKEASQDYRYFPDPDLLPLRISDELISEIKAKLPELPDQKKERFIKDMKLDEYDAGLLCKDIDLASFFEAVVNQCGEPKMAANWLITELLAKINREEISVEYSPISPSMLGELITKIKDDTLSSKTAKTLFESLWNKPGDAIERIKSLGLEQIDDSNALEAIVNTVIKQNSDQVEQLKNGKTKVLGYLVGQIMKETSGKANPKKVNELIRTILEL